MAPPPQAVLDAILSPTTRVIRRVNIYEQDGMTEFLMNAKIVNGTVTVDQSRPERRNLDLELLNFDGELDPGPGGFWYDKVIKVYRGAIGTDGSEWTTQVGEFQIDRITEASNNLDLIKVTGRDYAKVLLNSKFRYTTLYESTDRLEDAVQAIAFAAGIRKFDLPFTNEVLDIDVIFEAGTLRWDAIKQLCVASSYEPYFKADGSLTMVEYSDPSSTPPDFTFDIGPEGVLVSYDKEANDNRLKNVFVVSGESSDTIPVTAVAANHTPGSPTSVEEIGERVDMVTSPLIVTEAQAQTLADNMLAVSALEEFSINFTSLVLPWLDVGSIIDLPAIDNGSTYYSTRYLFSSISIPLTLSPMSGNAKRITLV